MVHPGLPVTAHRVDPVYRPKHRSLVFHAYSQRFTAVYFRSGCVWHNELDGGPSMFDLLWQANIVRFLHGPFAGHQLDWQTRSKRLRMISRTSRKPNPPTAPQGQQQDWPIFVCGQGAFLFDPRAYHPVNPDKALKNLIENPKVYADPIRGFVALPACRDTDDVLNQPPLGLRLSQEEAEKLVEDTTGATDVFAATDTGPAGQDKASNQDFALAATIRITQPDGSLDVYQFVAVADGVTTRTFWPERSSRLAVLAAWRVARRYVDVAAGPSFSKKEIEEFCDSLVDELRKVLDDDMAVIKDTDVPAGWAPETYYHFRERRELWYNSTLLVALVGAKGGLLATCGDGGVVVRKTEDGETENTVLVRSTDDLSVSGVVSLSTDVVRFQHVRVALTSSTHVEIVMSTDGVDRSLRRDAGRDGADFDPYGSDLSNSPSSKILNTKMQARLAKIADREIDNISTAILHWRPPLRLQSLVRPDYRGEIAAEGDTVDAINARMESRYRPSLGLSSMPGARAKTEMPPTIPQARDTRWNNLDGPNLPAGMSSGTMGPISGMPHPSGEIGDFHSNPKWNIGGNRRTGTQSKSIGGQEPARPSFESSDIDAAVYQAIALTTKLLQLNSHEVIEKIKSTQGRDIFGNESNAIKIATSCKIIFFMFADQYSTDSFRRRIAEDGETDRRVDQIIFNSCNCRPCLRGKEIVFFKSYEFMGAIRRILEMHGDEDSEIQKTKRLIYPL